MDPAVYGDISRFENEIVARITKEVEGQLGYEKAHKKGPDNASPVERAVSAKADKYVMARREIVERECTAINNKIIEKNIKGKNRKIYYNSMYTTTLIVEATKSEIKAYAKMDVVNGISLYNEFTKEENLA